MFWLRLEDFLAAAVELWFPFWLVRTSRAETLLYFRQFGSRVMDFDFVVFFAAGTVGFSLIPTNPTMASTPAKMKTVSRIFMRGWDKGIACAH
jgi:hypothetical protein